VIRQGSLGLAYADDILLRALHLDDPVQHGARLGCLAVLGHLKGFRGEASMP
jgi:hypothetical protein